MNLFVSALLQPASRSFPSLGLKHASQGMLYNLIVLAIPHNTPLEVPRITVTINRMETG